MPRIRELDHFEEIVGRFQGLRIEERSVVIRLEDARVSVPLSALAHLQSLRLKSGDRISMLRTDDETHPIRLRRV